MNSVRRRYSRVGYCILYCLLTIHILYFTESLQNDFKSQWVVSKNLNSWLSPLDICLINDSRNISADEIMKDCENNLMAKQKLADFPPVRCRIGNTWPSRSKFCDSTDIPFAKRKHFLTSASGYDDPNDPVLKEFFEHLTKKNGILLMIGDSVMQQFMNAVACELSREGVWKDYNRFKNTDETQYISLKEVQNANELKTAEKSDDHSIKSAMKFLPIYHFVDGRYDRKPQAAFNSLVSTLHDCLQQYKTIIILVNMGLHYIENPSPGFSKTDYSAQMTKLLLYLSSFHNNATRLTQHSVEIVWRETTAQHFATNNGFWPGVKYTKDMKLGCFPIQDTSALADWRNREIERIISTHSLSSSIHYLPFYNLTVPLWSEHPNGMLKDCTHFCWTPMLYQPMFHYLRDLIRKKTIP
jgi:hypothetical protein